MKIKDIISDAMNMIGRDDCAEEMTNGAEEGESVRMAKTLLFCYNAVADELARAYFPLNYEETLSSQDGKFYFEQFSYTPVKILCVKSGEKSVDWDIFPGYLQCDENIVSVSYRYVPPKSAADDDFFYPDAEVSARMICYGMVSEYFLIGGEVSLANAWEQRYRTEIDSVLSKRTVKERVPPRRWL